MKTSKFQKISIILLIVGLIFIKILNPGVNAEEVNLNELFGNEIGNGSDLNTQEENTAVQNNTVQNNANKEVQNTVNNKVNNKTNNTTLPKTGTSENVLIALMVICIISSVYAYKKVKEYNI